MRIKFNNVYVHDCIVLAEFVQERVTVTVVVSVAWVHRDRLGVMVLLARVVEGSVGGVAAAASAARSAQ
jgi:hypothetical protein